MVIPEAVKVTAVIGTVSRCHRFMFTYMGRISSLGCPRYIPARFANPDHLNGLCVRLDRLYLGISSANALVNIHGIAITTSQLLAPSSSYTQHYIDRKSPASPLRNTDSRPRASIVPEAELPASMLSSLSVIHLRSSCLRRRAWRACVSHARTNHLNMRVSRKRGRRVTVRLFIPDILSQNLRFGR